MSIRLVSLTFQPKGPDGWTSTPLPFGRVFTFVHGKNGSGKTPIMKGIVYALGYPVEITPHVREHCSSVDLQLERDGRTITVSRHIDMPFEIVVMDPANVAPIVLKDELAASRWWLDTFSIPTRRWTDKDGKETLPYLSVIGPIFWVDQDIGWTTTYAPPKTKSFVSNQEEEVLRLVLGLPARKPFEEREEFLAAKRALDVLDERISVRREALQRVGSEQRTEGTDLEEQRRAVMGKLAEVQSGIEAISATTSQFNPQIEAQSRTCDKLRYDLNALEAQRARYARVAGEIDGELTILASNVTATEAFRSFCGNTGCSLFGTSEVSYGRRLLYLKDQLKDLTTSDGVVETELLRVRDQMTEEDVRLKALRTEREKAIASAGHERLSATIASLSRQLADIELRLARFRQFESEKSAFNAMLVRREELRVQVTELRPGGRRQGQDFLASVRSTFQDAMTRWLRVLKTPNIGEQIVLDEELRLWIDGIRFAETSHQSGSTRTRIVLAYHAAVLETALTNSGPHPGLLLFDAPRQHELNRTDLAEYFRALRALTRQYPGRVQVVLSLAEMLFTPEEGDEVWSPKYGSAEEPRYLGASPGK